MSATHEYITEDTTPPELQVSIAEVIELCYRIGDNKAPELDSIPNKAHRIALKTKPQLFADVFTKKPSERVFMGWKEKKLLLILKPDKTLD